MADAWLDIELAGEARRRQDLKRGLTMIGGEKSDVPLPAAGADRLHLWDAPPKVIFVGAGTRPRVNGSLCDECELRSGDVIEWYDARLEFGAEQRAAPIAPIAPIPAPLATALPPIGAGIPARDETMWRRLRAGLLVELGLSDPAATRRWQEAARRNEFEADACAREVLGIPVAADADEKLLERSSSMLRESLMSQLAARRAEKRSKRPKQMGCFAMIIGQALVFVVYAAVVAIVLFVIRQRWGWSVDTFLDSVIKRFT